jgi:WD40 repeat protein
VRACDISPDGRWILSVGDDFLLRIWEAESGQGAAACYLANPKVARFHPVRPALLTLDAGGHYQVLDLENIQYGPLVVTASDRGDGPALRCPHCWQVAPLEPAWLGQEIGCPQPDCGARLRINPFITEVVGG